MVCVHRGMSFSKKRNEILINDRTGIKLEHIILSERSQTQEDKYVCLHLYGISGTGRFRDRSLRGDQELRGERMGSHCFMGAEFLLGEVGGGKCCQQRVVMVAQQSGCNECQCIVHLKWLKWQVLPQ